jgi:micrococcal nuclease
MAVIMIDGCTPRGPSSYRPSYPGAQWIDKKDIRFDDGDTFFLKDKPVRILGIDTPEVADPNIGIYEDQPYGSAASDSTRALITRAALVEYVPDGRDRYGRLLAHIFVDGELLALHLIRMGLAYETVGYYGDNGFPDLAQKILNTARSSPKPKFQKPHSWRRKHQHRSRR